MERGIGEELWRKKTLGSSPKLYTKSSTLFDYFVYYVVVSVEIEYFPIAYFSRFTTFKAL